MLQYLYCSLHWKDWHCALDVQRALQAAMLGRLPVLWRRRSLPQTQPLMPQVTPTVAVWVATTSMVWVEVTSTVLVTGGRVSWPQQSARISSQCCEEEL